MFTNQSETQDRGQVGIGTLIVFIALVLVAAIAAGVLINTAGFLQSQAESTGQESTDQVSNTIQTYNAYASTDGNSPASVDGITIPLGLAPGADAVDLADVTVEVFVEGQSSDYVAGVTGSSNLLESGGTYEYTYNDDGSLSLSAGTEVEFVFTTADGAQTSVIANIPDPLNTNGDPVSL